MMRKFRTHWLRWTLIILLALLIGALGVTQVARAVEYDDDGIIGPDEVINDDIFVSAEKVVIDGTVNGILFASGGVVEINGTVNGDLLVTSADVTFNGQVNGNMAFAGQFLVMNGGVDGSLFAASNTVTFSPSASIGRNVLFAGLSLETMPGSSVGRDLEATGMQAQLAGQVDRNVMASVAALEVEGRVGGDVWAEVEGPESDSGGLGFLRFLFGMPETSPSGLHVSEEAQIEGTLTYTSPVEQADGIKAQPGGGVVYQLPDKAKLRVESQGQAVQWFLKRVQDTIALFVLGGLAAWKLPGLLGSLSDQARAKPLPACGWGVVMLVAGHITILCLAILVAILWLLFSVVTLGGLGGAVGGVGISGVALVFALFRVAVAYGAELVVAYLIGKLLLRRFAPRYTGAFWPMMLGVGLYTMARFIPLLGWVIGVIATLIGLGAMWMLYKYRRCKDAPVEAASAE